MSDHDATKSRWQQSVDRALDKAPERRERFSTSSDIAVQRLVPAALVNLQDGENLNAIALAVVQQHVVTKSEQRGIGDDRRDQRIPEFGRQR